MGYDIHITRKEHWSDEGSDITLAEWTDYVKSDPEMRLDGFAEAETESGSLIRVDNEGLSVWAAYSGHEQNGNRAWFDYRRGCIVVKNPDKEILRKMWRISRALSAKVQGDEGEFYGADGAALGERKDSSADERHEKPWWKIW